LALPVPHPGSTSNPPAERGDRRAAAVVLAAALPYGAVLAGVLPHEAWVLLPAAALLSAAAVLIWRWGVHPLLPVVAFWPPLHLLLLATGGLSSFLLPLAALWLGLIPGRGRARLAAALAASALLLLPADPLLAATAPRLGELILVFGVGLAFGHLRAGGGRVQSEEAPEGGVSEVKAQGSDGEYLQRLMEMARHACGSEEAALWVANTEAGTASRMARAGPEEEIPRHRVQLEGHPFAWAISEGVHVHLERGRRELPTEWAEEMLLVPVDVRGGLLVLGFAGPVPSGAEAAAIAAAAHVSDALRLVRARVRAEKDAARREALLEVARVIPDEVESGAFAELLVDTVVRAVGARGAAVVTWNGSRGEGEVARSVGGWGVSGGTPLVREGESRLALALKHGVRLHYDDLRREKEELPLLAHGERWETPPRAAVIAPLVHEGEAMGAIVAWHPEPRWFGEGEREFLDLLRMLAAPALRSTRRYEALNQRASTDALTSLPNRSVFEQRLASVGSYFQRYARPFSLLVLDIDHFKRFNDSWGHEAGDAVLRHVAEILDQAVRDVDLAARLGGEEFVILLPETGLRDAVEVGERVRRSIESQPLTWGSQSLRVTASLGVAACPDCCVDPSEVMAAADAALYRSKGGGRNRVTAATRREAPAH
jgi:diguanylate cyclase (GGDEF)-like protein